MTATAHLVDSSGWLEFFGGGPNAEVYAAVIEDLQHLVVPTIAIVEVRRRLLAQRGPTVAAESIALMLQGTTVPLDESLASEAAFLGVTERLALADSIILATARRHGATVWTSDADFERFPDVQFIPRQA